MARRRGAEVQEEAQLGGLTFDEPLSWRAGKPIPTGVLLKRLDALSNELREMDQEETDKDSLTKVAKDLAGQNLLGHKDKGVRAFTACCLVDVLKICAPDAPFTGSQLKDIFTLFITSILPALSDPSNAYNTQHKYVLVSLAEVKSIVLLMDLPNSEGLTLHLFASFFDIISGSTKASTGEQIAKDVEYHMSQMLVTLVDEAASLPHQVVDVIVAQFLRTTAPGAGKTKHGETQSDENQSTLLPKELPEAYNMAKTICNSCPEKMARYVSQYFNEVIMEVSSNAPPKSNGHRRASEIAGSDDEDGPTGPTEADLRELGKAHKLLCELWRASPSVLQNVIPQLEAELSAENVQLRRLATETLGDIISGIGAAGPPSPPTMDPAAYPPAKVEDYPTSPASNSILTTPISPQSFAQTHPMVYHSFLGRKNDKSAIIRSAWTTAVGRILVTSAGGIGLSREDENSLVQGLGEKLNDADERVRIAAIKAIASFGFRDVMEKLAPNGGVSKPGSVLSTLADRGRDRKHVVRVEGMTTLARIWGVAAGEIAAGNESVISALSTIPTRVFDAYYANDMELNVLLDHVMFEQLIPLSYPPTKAKPSKTSNGDSQSSQTNGDGPFDADKLRVERILLVVKSLDAKSKKAFFAMQARQSTFSEVLAAFLKRCEEFNGGVMDENSKEIKSKLDAVIRWFTGLLPDPLRTSSELYKYAKLHDRRSYQLLRFAMGSENDFKTVHKAIKEFIKRIQSAPGAPAGLLETLEPIIYRSASLVYNRSHLPAMLQYSRSDENGLGATAHEVMHEISERMPQIFSSNVKELCKSLQEDAPSETRTNEAGSVETLRACAEFAKNRPKDIPHDRKFTQTLINFALFGTPPKAAKYAVSILMATSDRKEMHAKDLLEKTTAGWTYGGDHFLTKLATICQLSLLENKMTDEISDEILDITTQQVLLQVRTPAQDSDPSWISDLELDEECQAKSWALKTLVNRLRATEDPETAKRLAVPVYKLLNALIVKDGELSKKDDTPKAHKSRLRLLAAQLMLKLCTNKLFDDILTPTEFNRIAFVAQDRQAKVRRGFIEKLQKYLVKGRLSNRFYTIIFLTAFEPEVEFKNSIITWIRSRAKVFAEKKSHAIESIFARLLSLLAHHPDYSTDPEELRDHARYILYYITTVASEDNLALIYKYAERVKQARDGINAKESDRLYVLSDLAQAVIRKWEEKKGWSMQTWPLKVGLPTGLFAALPSHEVAQEIAEKQYLPEEVDDLLNGLVRNAEKKKKRKVDDKEEDGQPTAKRVKSEPKPKSARAVGSNKDKAAREKKTPKAKKQKRIQDLSTPTASSADRRRSGRGTSAKKSYADRDDSEDEEEMMEGVAKWKYFDGDSDAEEVQPEDEDAGSEGEDNEDTGKEQNPATPEVEAVAEPESGSEAEPEPVPELMDEDDEEGEDPEAEPTPPRSNGRKSRAKAKPVVKEKKGTPAPKVQPPKVLKKKSKSPLMLKSKAKTPIVRKPAAAKGKGKGKGKESRVKDVFDIDESE